MQIQLQNLYLITKFYCNTNKHFFKVIKKNSQNDLLFKFYSFLFAIKHTHITANAIISAIFCS